MEGLRKFQEFRLTGVQETGTEIGKGSYAAVVELQFRGLECAGKKLYPHLYDGVGMLQRFENECEILGHARHPNIVQFLGVTFEDGTELPTIVMEFMHTTLASCIDQYGVLPKEVSYPILNDIATALCYLHGGNPQIIYRDLTANNVLLTQDMQAKISDLGVAKILGLTPARMTQMTTCPGTPAYMPPEALEPNPTYTTSIDSFSYGVTMIHLLSGRWPLPSSATVVDPQNPGTVTARTEAQRRQEYLDDIGQDHPLMTLILECLSNSPNHRPKAEDILQRVAEERQPAFLDKVALMRADNEQKEELKRILDKAEQTFEFLTNQKQRQVNQLQGDKDRLKALLKARNEEVSQIVSLFSSKNQEIEATVSLLSAKDQEIEAMRAVVDAKTQQVQELTAIIEKKDNTIALTQKEIEEKTFENSQLMKDKQQIMDRLLATEKAYALMEEMRQRMPTVNMAYYVDIRTIETIHSGLGIPLGLGVGGGVRCEASEGSRDGPRVWGRGGGGTLRH